MADCGAQVMRAESPPYSQIAAAYASGGEVSFSRRMSHWILRKISRGEVGNVLDIACGAGEAVRVFRNAGWQAVGLDKSASMLRLARARNGLGATFRRGTMQQRASVRVRFNLVTCMYDAINCNLRVEDLFATFRNAHWVLAPCGRFVFDAYTPGGLHRAYGDGWELHTRNRDHIVFSAARIDRRRHVGTKEFVGASRVTEWKLWREVHQVRAYPTKVLLEGLSQARFTSVTMYGWPSGLMVSPSGADDLDRIVIVAQRGELARSR
jgi:SAM-dependent methyltransferase